MTEMRLGLMPQISGSWCIQPCASYGPLFLSLVVTNCSGERCFPQGSKQSKMNLKGRNVPGSVVHTKHLVHKMTNLGKQILMNSYMILL